MRLTTLKFLVTSMFLSGSMLAGSYAVAAEEAASSAAEQPQAQQQEAKPDAPDAQQSKRKRGRRMTEISKCKQEARGMRGPDRGSFMTECLGSDRNEK